MLKEITTEKRIYTGQHQSTLLEDDSIVTKESFEVLQIATKLTQNYVQV